MTPIAPTPPIDPRDQTIRLQRIIILIISLIAVALGVALGVVSLGPDAGPPTDPSANETTASAPQTIERLFFEHYVGVSAALKPEAIIVEIHLDYQCPWCGHAEKIYGGALYELSQSGDVDLRIHLRTAIGDQFNDASERASRAALCADTIGDFWAYHSAIFANQPTEGVGFTDQQLREDFPAQASITGGSLTQFLACYDSGATANEVKAMEDEAAAAQVYQTPTFFVNGLPASFNLQTDTPASTPDLLAALRQIVG